MLFLLPSGRRVAYRSRLFGEQQLDPVGVSRQTITSADGYAIHRIGERCRVSTSTATYTRQSYVLLRPSPCSNRMSENYALHKCRSSADPAHR